PAPRYCSLSLRHPVPSLFFFTDTSTTAIYTLSLHDALPISAPRPDRAPRSKSRTRPTRSRSCTTCPRRTTRACSRSRGRSPTFRDRKSTRLNSSHVAISYAVFCLKKKKKKKTSYKYKRHQLN